MPFSCTNGLSHLAGRGKNEAWYCCPFIDPVYRLRNGFEHHLGHHLPAAELLHACKSISLAARRGVWLHPLRWTCLVVRG